MTINSFISVKRTDYINIEIQRFVFDDDDDDDKVNNNKSIIDNFFVPSINKKYILLYRKPLCS